MYQIFWNFNFTGTSKLILSLLLIQEGQLSVSGKRINVHNTG